MTAKGCKSDFGDIRRIDGKNYYKHYVCRSKACAKNQAAALKKRVMDVVPPKSFELKCSVRAIKERQGYGIWMWHSTPSGTRRGTPPTVGTKPRKKQATTIKKVKSHQPMGKYKKISVDERREAADFRLLQVSPNVIRWRSGKTETVTAATLKKLQRTHAWATDF